ncbi:MAG TPA: RsmE family RNA methyltransferase, partial [Candidatus Babeliales bacterium]|nr:RsmE family RNA methyltransferase [Candidatus Babeliales bacterium]
EALSAALYSCVELGANQIQLIVTEKSEKAGAKFSARQLAHLEQIMIAAAEQSKYFCLPELLAPVSLSQFLAAPVRPRVVKNRSVAQTAVANATSQIFFDPTGIPISVLLPQLAAAPNVRLLWGPEGDLTAAEKAQVMAAGFTAGKLTPTILRAAQAVAVGLGLIRSLV